MRRSRAGFLSAVAILVACAGLVLAHRREPVPVEIVVRPDAVFANGYDTAGLLWNQSSSPSVSAAAPDLTLTFWPLPPKAPPRAAGRSMAVRG
jgi:hypothetical protein